MADGTTTTLADTLLDDLDDLSDGDEEENEEEQQGAVVAEEIEEGISGETPKSRHESSFLSNPDLKRHLANIEASPSNNDLIVPSNLLLSKLRDSLHEAHLELQRLYEPKFPELSDLLGNVFQYTRAIELLQNEMDVTKVDFSSILTPNQIITISVAGSTTLGRPLSDEELSQVREQCQLVHSIRSTQETLQKFVESRMNDWAPNISTLLGPPIAAQVLGLVGGLAEVSRIPACNLQVLGQEKTRDLAGKSGVAARPHAGILYACDLVQQAGSLQNKKKALKVVAAKLALAARVDFVNWDTGRPRNNASGVKFRQEIVKKLQQWETPDKAPVLKALPKPDLSTKKRRGGKRMRRWKENFEETEMMKQANKREFSAQSGEYGDDAMGLTLGMLESGSGVKVTAKKMRQSNTKAARKRQAQIAASSSSSNNGLASSMVFTPVQGMELVDPEAQRKRRVEEANKKWFSANAGFTSALPKKT